MTVRVSIESEIREMCMMREVDIIDYIENLLFVIVYNPAQMRATAKSNLQYEAVHIHVRYKPIRVSREWKPQQIETSCNRL